MYHSIGIFIGGILWLILSIVVSFYVIRLAVRANRQVQILEGIHAKQIKQIQLLEQLVQQQQQPNPIEE